VKLFEAILDVAILPFSMARDVLDIDNLAQGGKSFTRRQVEKIDEDIRE